MDIQQQIFYTGVVENRQDPLFLGRCQVRVVGLHTEDKNELPTAALPWAYPMGPITSASMNGIGNTPLGPVEGSWVMIIFRDVEKQQPIMMGTVGGIPQQDNNANIERDDDNYLLNTDEGEVYTTASGVPIKVRPDGVIVGGEVGSTLGGRASLAASVNEVNAALGIITGGPLNTSRVGVSGPVLASMSAYTSPTNSGVYGTANNSPYARQQYELNRLSAGLSQYNNSISPQVYAVVQSQYNAYQAVGALTNNVDTVSTQIGQLTTGFQTVTNSVFSGVNTVQSSFNGLQGSFVNVANAFGQVGNVRAFQISGLPGFDNLATFSDGRGGYTGLVGGINKVTGQIQQGVGTVLNTVNSAVQQVQGVANTITSTAAYVQNQVQIAGAYGQVLNDKFNLGLSGDQQVLLGGAANIVLTQALKNPKVAAVANALITTKKAFDTINRVIGKYTKAPGAVTYYSPIGVANPTRPLQAANLYRTVTPIEVLATNVVSQAQEVAGKINSTAQEIAGTINEVTSKINEFAGKVAEVAVDVGTVVGAVASTAGAWQQVGNAFSKQKSGTAGGAGGGGAYGAGSSGGGAGGAYGGAGGINGGNTGNVVLASGKLEVQFNRYDIITIVGLMQTTDLQRFRDAMGLFKSLSIPQAPINFNVNGVVGGQNYGVVSPIGELGKYQINAEQLAQLGYVKYLTNVKGERVFPSNFRLASNDIWQGKSGMTSIQKFVSTPAIQEKMMNELVAFNYDQLILDGIITPTTRVEQIGGYLSIAHNTGLFAVKQFVNGENVVNARGQTAYEAYQLGHTAVKGGEAATTPGLQPAENPDPDQPALGEIGADGRPSLGRPIDKTEAIGFRDPNRKYPLGSALNEPDTNRLGRNQFISKTVVDLKDSRRDRKVVIGGIGATWDEPPSPYDALYPFNHVYQSESGHIVEYDDTPNRERMHWYHTRGTFMEWDSNGTSVRKIVGDGYEIFERNGFIHVKGECNLTVEGNCNVMVKSNATIEVLGTTQGYFRNDFNAEVSGNMNLSVKESFQLKARDIHMETTGSLTSQALATDGFFRLKANGPYIASAEGDWNVTARNNLYQQAGDRASLNAGNNVYIYGNNNINLFSQLGSINNFAALNYTAQSLGTLYLNTGGLMSFFTTGILAMTGTTSANLSAAGVLNLNATLVNLASPVIVPGTLPPLIPQFIAQQPQIPLDSLPPFTVVPAVPILPTRNLTDPEDLLNAFYLPTPSARGTPVNPKYDILSLPPRGLNKSQVFESPDEGSEKEFVDQQIKRGKINPNEKPNSQEDKTVEQTPKQGKPPACESFRNIQDFPLSTKLSPNFYLGDFIPGGGGKYICQASTPQTLRDVPGGFTKQEIVCNLKGFAENVMERLITVVPKQDIIVTSGWRFPGSIGANESSRSVHPAGGAVDIVLRSFGNDRRKHYELAQKLQRVIPFDQIILEYENGKKGSLVWIHIGYNSWQNSQRGQAFTMNNHSTYKRDGFSLLT
jgi:hypothetical protein